MVSDAIQQSVLPSIPSYGTHTTGKEYMQFVLSKTTEGSYEVWAMADGHDLR